MKKLPLALAIGAAVSVPAQADTSSVEIYGKLYPFLINEKGSGATSAGSSVSTLSAAPSGENAIRGTSGMQAGNSRLGFRGKEDLGGGMTALFQLEQTVSVNSGGGGAWNRDTFVGLDGDFGTVRLGNMDTFFKNYGDTIGVLGISSGTFLSTSDVLRKTGFGTSSASSFHLRRANSIAYESPEIAGFQAGLQWSTNEAKTDNRDPRVLSMGIKYDQGPFYFAIAHEIHYDLFGGSLNAPDDMRNNEDDAVNSKDKATQITFEYRLNKNHKFEFDVIRKSYKEDASTVGRFRSYKNTAYLLAMENRWSDQWRTSAHYVRATAGSCERQDADCDTDGLNGSKIAVAAAYYLSKRTYVFGAYSRLMNGNSARYSNAEFDNDPNTGENISQFALGLVHSF